MAVENRKSQIIIDLDNRKQPHVSKYRSNIRNVIGATTVDADDSATSTYRVLRLSSSDRLVDIDIKFQAAGGSATLDAGLAHTTDKNDGALIGAQDRFANDYSIVAAQPRFTSFLNSFSVDDAFKYVYEIAGYEKDPNLYFDVLVTLNGDPANDAQLAFSAIVASA